MTILETLQKEFPNIKYRTYYSDLYIWHENLQSVEDFLKTEHIHYRKFIDNIDHVTWIEITLGYSEYFNK
jgi:hypothetical protein